ncbi:MAG: restriction endonuclease [Anaeromyxobacteraceae bacterium]|nr:restriction endonuclease [Anaeromyxobacteraceae bacterium]
MSVLLLVVAATALGFLVILLAGRGQRTSPAAPGEAPVSGAGADGALDWVRPLGGEGLQRLLVALFGELGFEAEASEPGPDGVEFVAVNPAPIRGGRVLVHGVLGGVPVDGDAVRALLDTARAESVGRAVLATLGRFTEDAREAARGNPVDLLDADDLAAMVKRHLPQAHATRML